MLATVGAVFLATPFRGSDAAPQVKWLVTIKEIMGEQSSDQLIKDLEKEHDFVHQRVQRFAEVAHATSTQLPVHCFYETQKTELLQKLLSRNIASKLAWRRTNKIVSSLPTDCQCQGPPGLPPSSLLPSLLPASTDSFVMA